MVRDRVTWKTPRADRTIGTIRILNRIIPPGLNSATVPRLVASEDREMSAHPALRLAGGTDRPRPAQRNVKSGLPLRFATQFSVSFRWERRTSLRR